MDLNVIPIRGTTRQLITVQSWKKERKKTPVYNLVKFSLEFRNWEWRAIPTDMNPQRPCTGIVCDRFLFVHLTSSAVGHLTGVIVLSPKRRARCSPAFEVWACDAAHSTGKDCGGHFGIFRIGRSGRPWAAEIFWLSLCARFRLLLLFHTT